MGMKTEEKTNMFTISSAVQPPKTPFHIEQPVTILLQASSLGTRDMTIPCQKPSRCRD
jgi:hypothetical protein